MPNFKEAVLAETLKTIAIDFDGVIHKFSKGIHDCTIYDKPVKGTKEALKEISKKYCIVIFTCRALFDNPIIEGKSGIDRVWEWLDKYELSKYIRHVTSVKPRALFYIDDKGITFTDWETTLGVIDAR